VILTLTIALRFAGSVHGRHSFPVSGHKTIIGFIIAEPAGFLQSLRRSLSNRNALKLSAANKTDSKTHSPRFQTLKMGRNKVQAKRVGIQASSSMIFFPAARPDSNLRPYGSELNSLTTMYKYW
jgi:hypothetical protein